MSTEVPETGPADHAGRPTRLRIAAVGDVHCGRASEGKLRDVFAQAAQVADVLLLCGDLTNWGTAEEAHVLAKELQPAARMEILAVLGNHDLESGQQHELCAILSDAGVAFLDGEARVVHGVGFAGVKGFMGGFGGQGLQPWGEEGVKRLVHETIEEALRLESALAKLRTPHRIAVLHYSPIQETVEGEPPAIFPFLGSSRLEEPINRYAVTAAFHGHAHHGSLEGRTMNGTPVYNVALPLLRRARPEGPPFHLLELALEPLEPA